MLTRAQQRNLFTDYFVLYHPAAEEKKALTTADKIKAKDPIIFGVLKCQPDIFYFVADWEDEHCDLTLTKLVDDLKTLEQDYALEEVRVPTDNDVEKLRAEVMRRVELVETTNSGNYVQREKAERQAEKSWAARAASRATGWVQRLFKA